MTTKQIDDGGPAFPNIWEDNPSPGMSLRDWDAGLAMQAIISKYGITESHADITIWAIEAYAHADAMLAERAAVAKAKEEA